MPTEYDLPELGGMEANNFLAKLLKERKIRGDIAGLDYELNTKGLKLKGERENALAEAYLKYNGDWRVNMNSPLFGGNLDFSANSKDGQKYYGLRYNRSF